MPLLNSFFVNIKEGKAIRAAVPLVGVVEKVRLHCFYGKAQPPAFTLFFPEGSLAVDQVDSSRTCMVMIDFIDQTITLAADISKIRDPQTLEVIAQDLVTHRQSRGYFRVDAHTRVAASSATPEELAQEEEGWRLSGDTIDLSGSGLLCSFNEPLEKGKAVKIELTLPSRAMETINAVGHVVRCRKVIEDLYHVALHFDSIDSESQDKIMACCFELQRRHLRMRVQVRN